MSLWTKLFLLDEPASAAEQHQEKREIRAETAAIPRGPACFLILIDNSGSMLGQDFPPSRILAACGAARMALETLRKRSPESLLGVGTFGDDFHECSRPRPVGTEWQAILAGLADLGNGGSTRMDRGLEGILAMKRRFCPTGQKLVLLVLTDGHTTSPKGAVLHAASALSKEGAEIWAIGIGGSPNDVDDALLKRIVSKPNQYVFIGNWKGAEAIFETFRQVVGLYLPPEKEG